MFFFSPVYSTSTPYRYIKDVPALVPGLKIQNNCRSPSVRKFSDISSVCIVTTM